MPRPAYQVRKKTRLDAYIDQEVDQELRDYAVREEIPLSTLVNKALKDYLKKLKVEVEKSA